MEYKIGQTVFLKAAVDEAIIAHYFGDASVPICFTITDVIRTTIENNNYIKYVLRSTLGQTITVKGCELVTAEFVLNFMIDQKNNTKD